jgi:hypothetical protein
MRIGSRFSKGVVILLLLFGITYILSLIPLTAYFIDHNLLLRPIDALSRRPYQLVSGPAIMSSFFGLLFVGILLWSLGSAIEERVGTRRFLYWMGGASLAAAVMAAIVGRLWHAMAFQPVVFDGQPVFLAALVAFAQLYGSLQVRMWGIGEPVSGRGLSYFFIGLAFVAAAFRAQWIELASELAAVSFMLVLLRRPWNGQGLSRGKLGAFFRGLSRKAQGKRRPFEVLDGGGGKGLRRPGSQEPRWIN